jgi:TetR/AcrR family transcriptional repressor of lmrAB and yxaGH operons
MSAPPRHRGAIVRAAAALFRRNGYAATGINEIADVSGAPKGSLYHYFPRGKDQIGEAAVRFAGAGVVATLEKLEQEHGSASSMIRAYCKLLAGWMAKSGFRDGCPIATTLLESAPQSTDMATAGREAFAGWCAVIALAVSSIEGALILARVEASAQPIEEVARALGAALRINASARMRITA